MYLGVVLYKGSENMIVRFTVGDDVDKVIRRIPDISWVPAHRGWLLPLNRDSYRQVMNACAGLASVNYTDLKEYLNRRKEEKERIVDVAVPALDTGSRAPGISVEGISEVNVPEMVKMVDILKLKAYSPSTIKTYRNEFSVFLRTIGNTAAAEMDEEKIKRYLLYCYETLELSENTLHSRINALKFYYEQVLGKDRFFLKIPRPKRPLQLPKLLNEDELTRLFNSLSNKKHKAMLFTAYSAGLRVSEIVNLKIADIDSGRMQILVRKAKGKKDRYVNLSPVLLDILRSYIKSYTPRPREYLFESAQTFAAYPVRTVQQIFSNAKRRAGIRKEVGVHSLRHSFATH